MKNELEKYTKTFWEGLGWDKNDEKHTYEKVSNEGEAPELVALPETLAREIAKKVRRREIDAGIVATIKTAEKIHDMVDLQYRKIKTLEKL